MVEPNEQYEDEHTIPGEAMPVVQRRGARWPLLVAVVIVLAVATVVYVNRGTVAAPDRGTLAAPDIMAYSQNSDPYFVADDTEAGGTIDEVVLHQRRLRMVQASMSCKDVRYTPLGNISGVWSVSCAKWRWW